MRSALDGGVSRRSARGAPASQGRQAHGVEAAHQLGDPVARLTPSPERGGRKAGAGIHRQEGSGSGDMGGGLTPGARQVR